MLEDSVSLGYRERCAAFLEEYRARWAAEGRPEIQSAPVRRITGRKRRKRLARIVERDGANCWICGGSVDLTAKHRAGPSIDHVVRLADGGSNSIDNLKLAHPQCNARRDAERRAKSEEHRP